MNPHVVGILLGTLLGAAWGSRMRCCGCYGCGGSPSSSCKETVPGCREGRRCGFRDRRPQPDLGQTKLSGNSSVTLTQQHPACMAAHHCNQVETESVGDVTCTAIGPAASGTWRQRRGKPRGSCMHLDAAVRPGLALAGTVEWVEGAGVGERTREQETLNI
nr:lymphocyte antigen 6 complex locus protein G6d [Microcebus murinus]